MMKRPDQRQLDHLPRRGRVYTARFWRVLAERQMRAIRMIVLGNVSPQQAPEVSLVEHDDVVQ